MSNFVNEDELDYLLTLFDKELYLYFNIPNGNGSDIDDSSENDESDELEKISQNQPEATVMELVGSREQQDSSEEKV